MADNENVADRVRALIEEFADDPDDCRNLDIIVAHYSRLSPKGRSAHRLILSLEATGWFFRLSPNDQARFHELRGQLLDPVIAPALRVYDERTGYARTVGDLRRAVEDQRRRLTETERALAEAIAKEQRRRNKTNLKKVPRNEKIVNWKREGKTASETRELLVADIAKELVAAGWSEAEAKKIAEEKAPTVSAIETVRTRSGVRSPAPNGRRPRRRP